MRLLFFGTPADAVPPLRALVDAGHDVALVVTAPDRRRGRRGHDEPTPVRAAAEELGLPVRTPARASELVDEVTALEPELAVVVAYGQILPPRLLDAVPGGFVNVHFSLLPRWRGAAPVERAILAGDTETGVCVMALEAGLDTGPVFARAVLAIDDTETAGELRARLVTLGTELIVEVLPRVRSIEPVPQAGEPTYASKLTVDEFRLDAVVPAAELARRVRAANPRPGAWFVADGRRHKVWHAHAAPGSVAVGRVERPGVLGTVDGVLVLDEVQPEGRRTVPGPAWATGWQAPHLTLEP